MTKDEAFALALELEQSELKTNLIETSAHGDGSGKAHGPTPGWSPFVMRASAVMGGGMEMVSTERCRAARISPKRGPPLTTWGSRRA